MDLGDIAIPIEYTDLDTMIEGELIPNPNEIPIDHILPNATVGNYYSIWLHSVDGLRDPSANITGLPYGIHATISGAP